MTIAIELRVQKYEFFTTILRKPRAECCDVFMRRTLCVHNNIQLFQASKCWATCESSTGIINLKRWST